MPSEPAAPALSAAYPQIFVADMAASLAFYRDRLGFTDVFAYGEPPFYAQVRRGRARLNLRHVDGPVFVEGVRAREELLSAHIPVEGVIDVHGELCARGAPIHRALALQPWNATDFVIADPDGNLIGFSSPTAEQD